MHNPVSQGSKVASSHKCCHDATIGLEQENSTQGKKHVCMDHSGPFFAQQRRELCFEVLLSATHSNCHF